MRANKIRKDGMRDKRFSQEEYNTQDYSMNDWNDEWEELNTRIGVLGFTEQIDWEVENLIKKKGLTYDFYTTQRA